MIVRKIGQLTPLEQKQLNMLKIKWWLLNPAKKLKYFKTGVEQRLVGQKLFKECTDSPIKRVKT